MWLKILLPSRIFVYKTEVVNIVAESANGSFGILPQRRDCIASLVPGILSYVTATKEEVFIAVDTGLLVKNGAEVLVSVRRAVGPGPLSELRVLVNSEFLSLDEQERDLQMVLNKLESGFLAHFSDLSKV
ncbi:MAG: F-type H+-transporting ATPase subunit epsilon [Alphaproteobacteria bacterium]|jgi:F-type H+-transporting ATPase subunit epsilon